ncbi:MAG: sigma-70 family RNA polymerase sigma factor [Pirellulales bacterium]|nr:sigma-70 family RNA polymerase sigma factor [Pirellulales bacterium]
MNACCASLDNAMGSSLRRQTACAQSAVWAVLPALLRAVLRSWIRYGLAANRCRRRETAVAAACGPQSDGTEAAESPETSAADWADVRASLGGDGQAYARLVHRYQQPIGAYMWRFSRDRRQWEELVHDVFVDAYFSLATYAGRAPLAHWLKRIATRVGYRFWKSRQRHRREVPLSPITDLLTTSDRAEAARHAAEVVHQVLDRLAPRDRLVMTLGYLEGRSVEEVAGLTGWTPTMVKVQMHRARKRLAKICTQVGIEP